MAKFCTRCGKPLEEGQVCDCQAAATVAPTTTTASSIDFKESGKDCLDVVKGIFTKPVETIKNFTVDSKYIAGIILVVVTAIASGLYKIATLKSIYGSTSGKGFNMSDITSVLSGNLGLDKPNYLKEFFTTFAYNLVEYAAIAFIGYLIVSKLLKGKSSWKQMINATGAALTVVCLGYLLNSILVFIDAEFVGYLRGYVTTFAKMASVLFLYKGVAETAEVDKNKLYIWIPAMFVVGAAVIDILDKIFN